MGCTDLPPPPRGKVGTNGANPVIHAVKAERKRDQLKMNTNALNLEPDIRVLRAKARDNLTEDWITKHDKTNDDGDKIEEVPYRGSHDNTFDVNLSHLFGPTPSTTGDVSLLVLEAEMQADGRDLENPHVPINTDVLERATEQIIEAGHSPAWEQ